MHPEMSWAVSQVHMSELRREAEKARVAVPSRVARPRRDDEVARASLATRLRWARA